ncbi:MAG: hypothetical protein K2Y21_16130 [Phycisphaerales bacterium]|nr:hypothetical protein [Phycisphaerales bacterium]
MKSYRVQVEQGDDGWLVAIGVNLRGLVTQGRDFNELALMVRDAIEALTESDDFTIQLLVPASIRVGRTKPTTKATTKRRRKAA